MTKIKKRPSQGRWLGRYGGSASPAKSLDQFGEKRERGRSLQAQDSHLALNIPGSVSLFLF